MKHKSWRRVQFFLATLVVGTLVILVLDIVSGARDYYASDAEKSLVLGMLYFLARRHVNSLQSVPRASIATKARQLWAGVPRPSEQHARTIRMAALYVLALSCFGLLATNGSMYTGRTAFAYTLLIAGIIGLWADLCIFVESIK